MWSNRVPKGIRNYLWNENAAFCIQGAGKTSPTHGAIWIACVSPCKRHTGWRDRGPYIFELFKVNFLPGQDDYPHTSCFTTQIGSKAKHAVHAEPPLPRPKLFASASETVKCTHRNEWVEQVIGNQSVLQLKCARMHTRRAKSLAR